MLESCVFLKFRLSSNGTGQDKYYKVFIKCFHFLSDADLTSMYIMIYIPLTGIMIYISVTGIMIYISVTGIMIYIPLTGIMIYISMTGIK